MTLIIGIKCEDGVVLGADGAATYSTLGQSTIRQPIKKKLQLLGNQAVLGVSGPVGIGQRFGGEFARIRNLGIPDPLEPDIKLKQLSQCKPHEAMNHLRMVLWGIIGKEFEIAAALAHATGNPALIQGCLTHTLLCCLVETNPCLIHFDVQGSPELATEYLPFVAIGSGQMIADPFLAFIRRIYWPDSLPDVKLGVFSVIWALHHAIETHPGGVGNPIQIVTFQRSQNTWIAKDMPEDQWQEDLEAIKVLERRMASLPKELADDKQSPVREPPSPNEGN